MASSTKTGTGAHGTRTHGTGTHSGAIEAPLVLPVPSAGAAALPVELESAKPVSRKVFDESGLASGAGAKSGTVAGSGSL